LGRESKELIIKGTAVKVGGSSVLGLDEKVMILEIGGMA
jgi:hypothetical protein